MKEDALNLKKKKIILYDLGKQFNFIFELLSFNIRSNYKIPKNSEYTLYSYIMSNS